MSALHPTLKAWRRILEAIKRDLIIVLVAVGFMSQSLAEPGDVTRGQQDFRACAACHSLEPDRNDGSSLAGLWGRKAGGLPNFERYSDALKSSGIAWDGDTLDRWIADPQRRVPGNAMQFDVIMNAGSRADLLANKVGRYPRADCPGPDVRNGGMMGGGRDPNLKQIEPAEQVKAIIYYHDTYRVTIQVVS